MLPDSIRHQIETKHGVEYADMITFTGNFVILYDKEIKDGSLITTQIPIPLEKLIRITTIRPVEIRADAPQLIVEEKTTEPTID